MQFFSLNIVMSPLFKHAPVMCRRGTPEDQKHRKQTSRYRTQQRRGCFGTLPFFFRAFTQSGKKAFYTLREALKERDCARLKLKYVPGGCELRLGCHLFSYFHFQRGLCSNFPAISLGLGVGNCQCGFSGKLIRVHAIVLT